MPMIKRGTKMVLSRHKLLAGVKIKVPAPQKKGWRRESPLEKRLRTFRMARRRNQEGASPFVDDGKAGDAKLKGKMFSKSVPARVKAAYTRKVAKRVLSTQFPRGNSSRREKSAKVSAAKELKAKILATGNAKIQQFKAASVAYSKATMAKAATQRVMATTKERYIKRNATHRIRVNSHEAARLMRRSKTALHNSKKAAKTASALQESKGLASSSELRRKIQARPLQVEGSQECARCFQAQVGHCVQGPGRLLGSGMLYVPCAPAPRETLPQRGQGDGGEGLWI